VDRSSGNPYEDYYRDGKTFLRSFSTKINDEEFVWHRDKKDRLVEVISGEGWMFQYDNELPFPMVEGMSIEVKSYEYHRILKGSSDLVIRITE
jgi:hypothetical protein